MVPTGGGAIVNWSSTGGMNGSKTPVSIYCASKAGVISFTKQAAIEYARKGIRANAICPGLIVTELSGGREAIEKFPQLVEGAPMRRAGEPEEVAELACFLASDRRTVPHGRRHPDRRRPHGDHALMRPIRFGFTGGVSSKRTKLLESARTVEALGYSTFGLADHFVRPLAPLVAGQAVADATTTLRITQTVLAQDFRQPAVLAKELATLDVLSEGRLQVGLGAGWLRQEYEDAGMRFETASIRISAPRGDSDHPEGPLHRRAFQLRRRAPHRDGARRSTPAGATAAATDHDRRRRQEGARRRRPPGRHRAAHAQQSGRCDVARPFAVLGAGDRGEDRLDPRCRGESHR